MSLDFSAVDRPPVGRYVLDSSHSSIGFSARHAMVTKVHGTFNEVVGEGVVADSLEGSSLRVMIQAASVDTRNADRDAHLRSNDFFDMEQFPEIVFESEAIAQVGNTFRVSGPLVLKGVSNPVVVDLEYSGAAVDPFGNLRVGFEGRVVVNRKDWGLNWNSALDAGGVLVSDKVTLEFDVSAIRVPDDVSAEELDVEAEDSAAAVSFVAESEAEAESAAA